MAIAGRLPSLLWVTNDNTHFEQIESAGAPKADLAADINDFAFGPIASLRAATNSALFDHLVDDRQQRQRHSDAKLLRRLLIDHQCELARLLDGEIAGFLALQDSCNVDSCAANAV